MPSKSIDEELGNSHCIVPGNLERQVMCDMTNYDIYDELLAQGDVDVPYDWDDEDVNNFLSWANEQLEDEDSPQQVDCMNGRLFISTIKDYYYPCDDEE